MSNIFLSKNSNSGDVILTALKEGKRTIVKRSYNASKRLEKCAKIQQKEVNLTGDISAVPVNKILIEENYIEIEMPFVSGMSGESLYVYCDLQQLSLLAERLFDYVSENLAGCDEACDTSKLKFCAAIKISEVTSRALNGDKLKVSKDLIERVLNRLSALLDLIASPCPIGKAHGDLTFSNVIFACKTQKIWLIDYLDGFISTPYLDYAKLIQEFKYGWSARYLRGAIWTNSKIFNAHISQLLNGRNFDENIVNFFSLLNLFRITPYVNDEITLVWLENALEEELKCVY